MLEIADLHVQRGVTTVLRGLDLTVAEGVTVGLLGRNGAGKTTLLNTIAGLLRGQGGITVDGEPLLNLGATKVARKGVALAPEGRRLFPAMTVSENLVLGCHGARWFVKRPGDEVLKPIWDLFPALYEFRERKVASLSGGQQQMVCVGRALAARPRLLLLDEPTFGLSPQLTESMCVHLRSIASAGLTIVLAEQNVDTALDVVDEVAVVDGGVIALQGSADEIAKRPEFGRAMYGVTALT